MGNSASRTAAMDSAGSRTQLSSLVAAVTVALVMVFFTDTLAFLPSAALAGVVASAVLNLIEVKELRELWHMRRSEFWVAAVCLLSVLVFGPLEKGRDVTVALSRANQSTAALLAHYGLLELIGKDRLYPTNRHAIEAFRREVG